jgi:hypothetical protein
MQSTLLFYSTIFKFLEFSSKRKMFQIPYHLVKTVTTSSGTKFVTNPKANTNFFTDDNIRFWGILDTHDYIQYRLTTKGMSEAIEALEKLEVKSPDIKQFINSQQHLLRDIQRLRYAHMFNDWGVANNISKENSDKHELTVNLDSLLEQLELQNKKYLENRRSDSGAQETVAEKNISTTHVDAIKTDADPEKPKKHGQVRTGAGMF